jgi:hypothetical protein
MPRDGMAQGFLWDVVDYVPSLVDAQLTGRGAWVWGSSAADSDFRCGILASFTAGEQLLACTEGGTVYQIDTTTGALTNRGAVPVANQNPIQLFDDTVWFDRDGTNYPYVVRSSGAPIALTGANVPHARVGTVWRSYVVAGGAAGSEDTIRFSPPNTTVADWDVHAFYRTAGAITGLAGLRSILLVFHAGSVERIRGTTPPAGTDPGDLVLEPLFQQAGTTEPRSICYWQENVLFADEHGVQITDGAVIRNLCQQGNISSYWRNLYGLKQSLAASVFLDYYIITVVRVDGLTDTLVCDLNRRQWFRFSNIAAVSSFSSGGTTGMERIWVGIKGTSRLARISACFFPSTATGLQVDGNGSNVMPYLETPYYKLSAEGRKRVRFLYLSYDARNGTLGRTDDRPVSWQRQLREEDDPLPLPTGTGDLIECSYILSPQDTTWIDAGGLPPTSGYARYRLPVGKFPYGIAFQVKQVAPTTVTRINDLAVDAHGAERSRV